MSRTIKETGTIFGAESVQAILDNRKTLIFMPRWASRLMLEITALRVERLQKITSEDCQSEGIEPNFIPIAGKALWDKEMIERYACLWDSLNAKRGYGWDKNPWVWVISFRRLQ